MSHKLAGCLLAALAVPLAAQSTQSLISTPCNFKSNPEISVGLPTGALSWSLPIGVVPGDIPIVVTFRYQTWLTSAAANDLIPNPGGSVAVHDQTVPQNRGLWGSLNFGYLASPTADSGDGLLKEGTQVLEDGTHFHDRDWTKSVADGTLPLAFGFKAPPGGYATEASRTYGLYATTLAELGSWGPKVIQLSSMNQFKVLLDRNRARVYGYNEALNTFVPILWVDRFGHWVGFRWGHTSSSGVESFTVEATNASGKGIQVSWAAPGNSAEVFDLLRADFIGIPSPSLLVRGYGGPPSQHPSGLEGKAKQPVLLAVGGAVGRPTQVQIGAPGSLSVPGYVRSLPEAPDAPPTPIREWIFGYSDSELATIQDPRGVKTTFTFQNYLFPGITPALRGVSEVLSVDSATGACHSQAWSRGVPTRGGEPWTVSHVSGYSDGEDTEGRTMVYTFVDAGAGPEKATLQSVQIQGAAGNTQTSTYGSSIVDVNGTTQLGTVCSTATGRPKVEFLQEAEASTGGLRKETMKVNGEVLQTRTFTYGVPFHDLGPNPPTAVAVKRQGLPSVLERFGISNQGLMDRYTTEAGGQERGHTYTFDRDGRLTGLGIIASWTLSAGITRTYCPGPLGPTALTTSGPNLIQPLHEAWEYGDTGQVIRHKDTFGNTKSTTYDLWGRPLVVSLTGSPTLTFAYPDERTRAWRQGRLSGWDQFDGLGRLQARLRGDGVKETYGTDTYGRRVFVKESNGSATRTILAVTYDALDRKISERVVSGLARNYVYSARGSNQVVTITTADGPSSSQTLDPWGQAVATTDPRGGTQITFNEFGQTTQVMQTEPGGKTQVRRFAFDSIGKLTSLTEPETQTTIFADFNALGQPGLVRDATDRTIRRTYDALGRLLTLSSGSLSLSSAYRGPFLVGRISSDGISQEFSYGGPGGRMDMEALTIDGVKRTIAYGYDANGIFNKVTYPSGRVVGYGHDSHNRVSQVTHNGALLATVAFDTWGNRAALLFASGAKSTWQADEQGLHPQSWQVTHAGGNESRNYHYDALDHLTMAGEWTLQHDGQGRLTQASGFGLNTVHGYDGFGNNITHAISGTLKNGFTAFAMDTLVDNRIPGLQSNGALTGWVVEANGEASQIATGLASNRYLSLGWDPLGRLAASADSRTGVVHQYRYAPSGLRVSLRDTLNARENRQFVYTDGGLLLSEYLGDDTGKRDVIYIDAQAIAEADGVGIHELHSDHLGTPRLITSGSSGALEGRQAFGPYGEVIDVAPHTEGYQPLTGFTGHLRTDATGLIYMRGRFYSPAWHRFLHSDHGVDPASWNQFAYTDGNPFHATDPSGFMIRTQIDPRGPDGHVDGGGATVTVYEETPPPLPFIAPPMPNQPYFPSFPGAQPYFPGPRPHVPGQQPAPVSNPVSHPRPWGPAPPPAPPPPPYEGPAADPASHPRVANPATEGGKLARAVGQESGSAFGMLRARASGPFIAPNPASIADNPFYGDCQCVALVKAVCPRIPQQTSFWKPGCQVQGNNIVPGTAIATFGPDGDYQNISGQSHAALFLSQDDNGIKVVDQWSTQAPHTRVIPWASKDGRKSNEGSAYYVIERK